MGKEILPGIKQFDLSGKTAIVTGGSKGLGLAMAAGLASAGANIMLVNRNSSDCEIAAKSLTEDFGVRAFCHSADISVAREAECMVTAAVDKFGKVDILINSAGINIRGPIDAI